MSFILSGRYEINESEFLKYSSNGSDGCQSDISLKDIFPEYFEKSNKPPRLVMSTARAVLDEHFCNIPGYYNFDKLPLIRLYYDGLPSHAAKVKNDLLCSRLRQSVSQALQDDSDTESGPASPSQRKIGRLDQGISNVIRKGLGDNPTHDELNVWAERVSQDIYATPLNKPLPENIMAMGRSPLQFSAIWCPQMEEIIGSCATLKGFAKTTSTSEKLRREFLLLISAYIQGLLFVKNRQKGKIMISVSIKLLAQDKLAELYKLLLGRFHPLVRESIIIEITGLRRQAPSRHIQDHIRTLTSHVDTFLFENDLLSPLCETMTGTKPMAHGFKLSSVNLPPADVAPLIKKFVKKFGETDDQTYVKNVSLVDEIDMLFHSGITYIISPVLMPTQNKCITAKALSRAQILA